MVEHRIPVQEIEFEGHRARVEALYQADASGRFGFVRFSVIEPKRRGPKPGKRRGRKPGPKPGSKRRKASTAEKATE